jgi:thiamine biosynthesis protein ThiS
VKIVFNGKEIDVPDNSTVEQILEFQDVRRVAVWINDRQIFFPDYDTTVVEDGSEVVALGPLGGG